MGGFLAMKNDTCFLHVFAKKKSIIYEFPHDSKTTQNHVFLSKKLNSGVRIHFGDTFSTLFTKMKKNDIF